MLSIFVKVMPQVLPEVENDFTESGWKDFMNLMQGFLDEKGAPTFTSTFAASAKAKVLGEKDGIVRIRNSWHPDTEQ